VLAVGLLPLALVDFRSPCEMGLQKLRSSVPCAGRSPAAPQRHRPLTRRGLKETIELFGPDHRFVNSCNNLIQRQGLRMTQERHSRPSECNIKYQKSSAQSASAD
jgi:hypothetical protein